MTETEFDALLADPTKQITEDITWQEDDDHSPGLEFRVEVASAPAYPLFVVGRYNRQAGTLTYALIHRGIGRLYALDMGKDHHNPSCQYMGEKHKHRWTEQFRDKDAYVPDTITHDPCAASCRGLGAPPGRAHRSGKPGQRELR